MCNAKLCIYVSELDEPCKISNRTWYVTIYHCDGSVLDWCGRRYIAIPAKCGYLEIDVPPGCYYIRAVWSFRIGPGGVFYGNHFTDTGIVTACCDEKQCITLFTPHVHRCGILFDLAVRDLVAQEAIEPALADRVTKVVNEVVKHVGTPDNDFELGHLEELERLVRQQEG